MELLVKDPGKYRQQCLSPSRILLISGYEGAGKTKAHGTFQLCVRMAREVPVRLRSL